MQERLAHRAARLPCRRLRSGSGFPSRADSPGEPALSRAVPRRGTDHGPDRAGLTLRRARQGAVRGSDPEAFRRSGGAQHRKTAGGGEQPIRDPRPGDRSDGSRSDGRAFRRALARPALLRLRLRGGRRAADGVVVQRAPPEGRPSCYQVYAFRARLRGREGRPEGSPQ